MTTLEASGYLYEWFSINDSFCMEDNFMKVITITETPNEDKVAFLCALKSFEESGMIDSEFDPDKHRKYWILKKSFLSYTQNVDISPDTALKMSQLINVFCEKMQMDTDKCDPSSIQENDIKNIMFICEILTQNEKPLDSEADMS